MIKKIMSALLGCLMTFQAHAAIKTEVIDYSAEGTKLEGYLAYDDAISTPRPGILIVHDWMGLSQFTKDKAVQLAKEGYVAFAVDVYGEDKRPKDQKEAAQFADLYKKDRFLLRTRMIAAYNALTSMKGVDKQKMIVMGYCFGGMAALELARSGVPLIGTASFHGTLSSPTPIDAKNIHGKVLVMHGADDPNVPPQEVEAFKKEMQEGKVTMEFIAYPGAVHAFTNPEAGHDNKKGVAYNEAADKKSWQDFERFLKEIL
jgi:dienelactone hydrolase